jgi:hypothetical protein
MTIQQLYTRYLNEYNTWAKVSGARIQGELYEDNFTITLKKPSKVIPVLKVHAKIHDDELIKITHREGLRKETQYIKRT